MGADGVVQDVLELGVSHAEKVGVCVGWRRDGDVLFSGMNGERGVTREEREEGVLGAGVEKETSGDGAKSYCKYATCVLRVRAKCTAASVKLNDSAINIF